MKHVDSTLPLEEATDLDRTGPFLLLPFLEGGADGEDSLLLPFWRFRIIAPIKSGEHIRKSGKGGPEM